MTKVQKTPAFPFYGKDAYDDELFSLLSFGAQGLYLFLAWWQWQEGSIPADPKRIFGKVPRAKAQEAARLWPRVEQFFPVIESNPERRQNESVEERRRALMAKRGKHQEGAEATNKKRWFTGSLSDPVQGGESDSPRAASADAIATASRSPEEGTGETNPQRDAVRRILEACSEANRPEPALAAVWLQQLSTPEAVIAVVTKYPTKNAAYVNACINTAAREKPNAASSGRAAKQPTKPTERNKFGQRSVADLLGKTGVHPVPPTSDGGPNGAV